MENEGTMNLLEHEICAIAEKIAVRLVPHIQAIIHKEIRPMVDAVADLTAESAVVIADFAALMAEVTTLVNELATTPVDNTVAVEAQVARLKQASDAAEAFLKGLQPAPPPASPASPPASPAPASPAA